MIFKDLIMTKEEAIVHTKNKSGMKQSFSGLCFNSSKLLEFATQDQDVDYGAGYAYSLTVMAEHYNQAREAWLKGDLETVAEFFGLYV
jgi:hypothetical protein